tara:strand:+ start:471 stop:911 length:441 start_codon:yes stop_codon:yes gene_type:complete
MIDVKARIERLNANAPQFIRLLGGKVIALDRAAHRAVFTFTVPLDYCHSVDVVQGGFVTAMLDAAMSHALFGTDDSVSGVASLDIATQFMGICRGEQPLQVAGWVKKATYRTAFLEAELRDKTGGLIAAGQSVAKLTRESTDASPS